MDTIQYKFVWCSITFLRITNFIPVESYPTNLWFIQYYDLIKALRFPINLTNFTTIRNYSLLPRDFFAIKICPPFADSSEATGVFWITTTLLPDNFLFHNP